MHYASLVIKYVNVCVCTCRLKELQMMKAMLILAQTILFNTGSFTYRIPGEPGSLELRSTKLRLVWTIHPLSVSGREC